MAYEANVDYKALQNALKKQMEAETDAAKRAQLQSQYYAAEQSRTEKIASDLGAYGKYATNSELDAAAGIQAQNQIGTAFEKQAKSINSYFDTAKQNANNDALSRGMARSSFVSDRLANLDTSRAGALTDNDADKAAAIQSAKQSVLDTYRANTANALKQEKQDFTNTIGAYYNDFQAEINKVQNDNDTTNDWKIPYLQQARNEKLLSMQKATSATGNGGGGGGNPTVGDVYDRLYSSGITTPERAYAWLLGQGYSSTEANALAENYSYMYSNGEFGKSLTPTDTTTVADANFKGLIQTVNTYLGAGNPAAALSKVEGIWDNLSASQQQTLSAYFAERGYNLS